MTSRKIRDKFLGFNNKGHKNFNYTKEKLSIALIVIDSILQRILNTFNISFPECYIMIHLVTAVHQLSNADMSKLRTKECIPYYFDQYTVCCQWRAYKK